MDDVKITSYLYELSPAIAQVRFGGQKYWVSDKLDMRLAYSSNFIIEVRSDGTFTYKKNRTDGSTEVPMRDGSYDWITVQILSSQQVLKRNEFEAAAYYAPYIPLIVTNVSPSIEPLVKFRTRYGFVNTTI
jgi:hypothetical protein